MTPSSYVGVYQIAVVVIEKHRLAQNSRPFPAPYEREAPLPASETDGGSAAVLCGLGGYSRVPVGEGRGDSAGVDYHRAWEGQVGLISCHRATGSPMRMRVSSRMTRGKHCAAGKDAVLVTTQSCKWTYK